MSAVGRSESDLNHLLGAVDDAKLRQVVGLVEASGKRRNLEPALAALRPRLRRLRPQRPLTLPRLLTVPFEAALVRDDQDDWPFTISRAALDDWHTAILERLDPSTRDAAQAAIEGRLADDFDTVLAAGRLVWPKAAQLLAAAEAEDATAAESVARRRAADLLGIGIELVPLLARLQTPLERLDADEKETVSAILALAKGGPPDRLATLTMLVLQAAVRPFALAEPLLALVAPTLREPLRPVLDQLLKRHWTSLEQRVDMAAAAADWPLEQIATELWQLADALVGPSGQQTREAEPTREAAALRQQAATVGEQRYAAAIDDVVAPLPETVPTARVAAIKEREQTARRLRRLGVATQRLVPQTPIQGLTESALQRVLGLGETVSATPAEPISVDDARLVEILMGPDRAWQLLRPEAARR